MRRVFTLNQATDQYDGIGNFWCFAIINCPYKNVGYWRDRRLYHLTGWNAIILPPFSLIKWCCKPGNIFFDTYFSSSKITTEDFPCEPIVIPCSGLTFPKNPEEIFQFIRNQKYNDRASISICSDPEILAKKVKNYIDIHFEKTLSLSCVAKTLRISLTVMGRVFKNNFGLTPGEYRNFLRVRETMTELLFNKKSVTQIGFDNGFSDSSQLNRSFMRYAGVSPRNLHLAKGKNFVSG